MTIFLKKMQFVNRIFSNVEPKYGVLLITNKCNLDCSYCQVKEKLHVEIGLDKWLHVIEVLSNWGVSHFNILGGEPLLRKDLPDIVRFISQKGLGATVTTNGILLNEKKIEELSRNGLFMLIISLDGYEGRKGEIERVTSLLTYARKLGIVPVAHSVITTENIASIPELSKEVVSKGIFYSCSIYQAVGGLQSRSNTDLIPNLEEIEYVFSVLTELKRRTGMVRTTYEYMQNFSQHNQCKWRCNPNCTKWVAVQSNGNLMVCAEWGTSVNILGDKQANISEWSDQKRKIVAQCPGCYYECYYSEELVFSAKGLLREFPISTVFWRTVSQILFSNLK